MEYKKPQPYGQQPATGIPVGPSGPYYGGGDNQQHVPMNPPQPWSSGLFGCFEDVPTCCITCWCPCITFGRIADIVDKGATSCVASAAVYALIGFVTGCPCIYSCFYRSKLRQQYMLEGTSCGDRLSHGCCEACALCQEYRELKYLGFDMSIGWQGNMEKQNHGIRMAPMDQGGMTR